MAELNAVYRVRKDVTQKRSGDEILLQRAGRDDALALNEVGARIIAALDGITPASSIVGWLLEEYDVSRPRLERDVAAFLDELVDHGVAEVVLPEGR
jgi:hypothetical protein